MHKRKLRQLYKNKRFEFSTTQREQYSIDIANNCLQLDIWQRNMFHVFLTIDSLSEVQTSYLLSVLFGKDKNVVVPKSNFKDSTLQHFLLTDQTRLVTNTYGIPEPESGIVIDEKQLDVVFVPLLCADSYGNRVGYGKGFYDKFLKKCKPDAQFIGLCFFEPVAQILDTHENDVRLHALVTPHKIFHFGL